MGLLKGDLVIEISIMRLIMPVEYIYDIFPDCLKTKTYDGINYTNPIPFRCKFYTDIFREPS